MADMLQGLGYVVLYFIIAAGTALSCRMLISIPDELFRKILHCIVLGSLIVFVFGFDKWYFAALSALIFALVVYPVLAVLERIEGFSKLTTERKSGELKSSLLLVFGMFAAVLSVCWGWLGDRYLVLASIYAWGFGDAAAALVGEKYGEHKVRLKCTDGKKSIEGSLAMFIVSLVSVFIILFARGKMNVPETTAVSVGTAAASMFSELCSKDGNDTFICPMSAMVVLISLLCIFGGLS